MTFRKNLGDVILQDLILKWQYEDADGWDVYHVYTLSDYRVGMKPKGTVRLHPKADRIQMSLAKEVAGRRLQGTPPPVRSALLD